MADERLDLDDVFDNLVEYGTDYVMTELALDPAEFIPDEDGDVIRDMDDVAYDIEYYAEKWVDEYGNDSLNNFVMYSYDCYLFAQATGYDDDWEELEKEFGVHLTNMSDVGRYAAWEWYSQNSSDMKSAIIEKAKEKAAEELGKSFE